MHPSDEVNPWYICNLSPAGRTYHGNYRHFIADGSLPPLLTVQGFSVDRRHIVSGGTIGLYLGLPQEPGGTTRHDTSRARSDRADSCAQNDRFARSAARSQPNRSTVQADTPDPRP
jgi:hypothetical protein